MKEEELQPAVVRDKVGHLADAFDHFLRNNGHKHPKTIKNYSRFYTLFKTQFSPDMPCSQISKQICENSSGGKEKIIFVDEDVKKIFAGLKEKNSNFVTFVHVLFYTGLRSSDVLTINIEGIDLANETISYYSPKRKKYRVVPFHPELKSLLEERIMQLGRLLNFSSVENLGKAVFRYFEQIKLNSARTFRKTFITLCRSQYNMDASIVRELVGHEHTNTTDRYYNEITTERMKEELLKFRRPERKFYPRKTFCWQYDS